MDDDGVRWSVGQRAVSQQRGVFLGINHGVEIEGRRLRLTCAVSRNNASYSSGAITAARSRVGGCG